MSDPSVAADHRADDAPPFVGLHDRARRVGEWVWIERRVFETFGRWAGTTGSPAVDVHFGEMSRRHGWHAELFFDRLPELSSVDADALVRSPGPATEAFVVAAAAPPGPAVLGPLVAAYRVLLPVLLTEYRDAAESLSPVAEPSLRRWLDIVVRDDVEELCHGLELLDHLVGDADDVRAAADCQVDLELLALATGRLAR